MPGRTSKADRVSYRSGQCRPEVTSLNIVAGNRAHLASATLLQQKTRIAAPLYKPLSLRRSASDARFASIMVSVSTGTPLAVREISRFAALMPVIVNRAPVLTLWAAVVAERL